MRFMAIGVALVALAIPASAFAYSAEESGSTASPEAALVQGDVKDGLGSTASPEAALVQGDVKDGLGSAPAFAAAPAEPATPVAVVIPDEFHWGDAGLGALVAFGFALLAVSTAVVLLRHLRAPTPSS